MPNLRIEVSLSDLWSEFHFFHSDVGCLLSRLFGFLRFFVSELSVIHNATHGRIGKRCDFDKVEIEFASQYQCVGSGANTYLTTVGTDKTNLARTNALVVAGFTNWRSYGCSSVAMGRALLCVGTTGCGAFVPVHEADTERQNRS